MRNRLCSLALAVIIVAISPACQPSTIRVHLPPPAARIEPKPEAPTKEQSWIPGDWAWDKEKAVWAWRPGYYAKRPGKAKSYQRGRWAKRGYSYLWIPGKWLF